MQFTTWLDNVAARAERYFTTIGPETYLARDHTRDLVFASVDVRWNQHSWVECVLDDRDTASLRGTELHGCCKAWDQGDLLRDLPVLPPDIGKNIESYPRTVTDALDAGWPHRSRLRRAAISHAVAFETWRSLAHEGLTDTEAAQLIIGLISTADQP